MKRVKTKRRSNAQILYELRCQLIGHAYQERIAKKYGNKEMEANAALERDITTRAIEKKTKKRGKIRETKGWMDGN